MQAKYLLDAGASVDVVKISDAMTVLHWAAHHGKQELVHELLMHQKKKEKEREKEKKQNPTRTKRRLLC
jgi:ankyrin repeat protein